MTLSTSFEHFYSSQENHNLELVKLKLDTKDLNETEAIEHGWLIYEDKWYQCRSCRIALDRFIDYRIPKDITIEYTKNFSSEALDIYKAYMEYKGFKKSFNLLSDYYRMSFLILKDKEIPVAFTKFIEYDKGLESQVNAWNYHNPSLSLGTKILNFEVEIARGKGLEHLYIGEGCEISSLYKADIPGFEWWTGSEWSTNIGKYKNLCIRDSSIQTLAELSDIFNG